MIPERIDEEGVWAAYNKLLKGNSSLVFFVLALCASSDYYGIKRLLHPQYYKTKYIDLDLPSEARLRRGEVHTFTVVVVAKNRPSQPSWLTATVSNSAATVAREEQAETGSRGSLCWF